MISQQIVFLTRGETLHMDHDHLSSIVIHHNSITSMHFSPSQYWANTTEYFSPFWCFILILVVYFQSTDDAIHTLLTALLQL